MQDIFQNVNRLDIHDKLESDNCGIDTYGWHDLHHELCNTDYFMIGQIPSYKQFLGIYAFEAIEMVRDYEQSNFGEASTDLSEPERAENMLAYVIGEYVSCRE